LTCVLRNDKILMLMRNKNESTSNEEKQIYNRLAVLRAERGLTRQELAEAVEVNYQTIGFLERGDYNPSLTLAFALSQYFGVPIEAIFSPQPFQPLKTWPTASSGQ
jgi:putative transcriptional regulator